MCGGKVRVALVGTGGWGREHARIFASRPDVDFVAVCGRTPDKAAARAAEEPDLVALCLGNQDHFATTLEVIRAGFPLFVEKPFVFDRARPTGSARSSSFRAGNGRGAKRTA